MDRLARGSLASIPTSFPDPPAVAESPPPEAPDLSTTCPQCHTQMQPEHAHYRCAKCGYRDSCCF